MVRLTDSNIQSENIYELSTFYFVEVGIKFMRKLTIPNFSYLCQNSKIN